MTTLITPPKETTLPRDPRSSCANGVSIVSRRLCVDVCSSYFLNGENCCKCWSYLKPGFHIVVSVVSVVRKNFIGQI